MEAGSVYGNFFEAWGSPTKKQTISNSSMNNMILLNDIHIYKLYANCDNKKKLYTDQTWVNAHHTNQYIWIDYDGKGGWKVPSGKRQRLIVVHAGGVQGWVDGADLVFKSKTNSVDNHDKMNTEHYMEWFTQQLLPKLPPNSVIIVDNATYHNRQKDKPQQQQTKKMTLNNG